jgi:hypothetical protein
MEKPGLLPIIEAQTTQWDRAFSERARNFLLDLLITARRTGKPLDIGAMQMPCEDVANMALACLVEFTGYSEEDFETVSDCLHMSSGMARHTASPQYVEALLDVLASCLFTKSHIDDGSAELAANEVPVLAQRLEALEWVVGSRHWHEKTLYAAANSEREARAKVSSRQSEKAQKSRTADVQKIINRLARQGLQAKELWPKFVSSLDAEGMHPVERDIDGQPFADYELGDAPRRMTFKSFSNRLSLARNPNTHG